MLLPSLIKMIIRTVKVSVEFEFYYDSHLATKDVSFPSVWITFVSEDEKPGTITNWLFFMFWLSSALSTPS